MKTLALLAGMTLMTACASVDSSYSYNYDTNFHNCSYPECNNSSIHEHMLPLDRW